MKRRSELPGQATSYTSIESFLDRTESPGEFIEIDYNGVPVHIRYEDLGYDTTFFALNGAIASTVETVPVWGGYGVTRNIEANRVLVSDPSLALDTELTLGWHGGNMWQPHYQSDLTRVIASLAGATRPVVYGASGGGFAALIAAAGIPGSTALAINPQTDVLKYLKFAIERYKRIAWNIGEDDTLPCVTDVVKTYSQFVPNRVIYVQNSGDLFHIENHFRNFMEASHPENKVKVLEPDLGKGHVGPGKDSYRTLLDVVTRFDDWHELCERLDDVTITRK